MSPWRIVLMGTPTSAVTSLKALLKSVVWVVGVVSPPDRPAGRGRSLQPSPIARLAREQGLPLLQPTKVRDNLDFLKQLRELAPDLIVVIAYGRILPPEILTIPPQRCVNVHFSLLPKYRGAAPIQWALMNDEPVTGVTTFFLTERLDAGPILLQKQVPIEPEDNAEILERRLASAGQTLLLETIDGLKGGRLTPRPQDDREATDAPSLTKEDGLLNWDLKAKTLACHVRALNPWPGAFTTWKGQRLKIYQARPVERRHEGAPGTVLSVREEGIEVACRSGVLLVEELQLEGRKRMPVPQFLRGHPISTGDPFTTQ